MIQEKLIKFILIDILRALRELLNRVPPKPTVEHYNIISNITDHIEVLESGKESTD